MLYIDCKIIHFKGKNAPYFLEIHKNVLYVLF